MTSVDLERSQDSITRTKPLAILVADDQEQVRMWCQLQLQKLGHRVVSASDGIEAASLLHDHSFDLVITDVIMPGRDGLELIIELRKSRPGVRILAMSGGGEYTSDRNCLRLAQNFGAHAVVIKPVTLASLQEGIALAMSAS